MSALACHTSTGPVILVCGEISGPKILAILNYMLDSLAMIGYYKDNVMR